jgi:hypothetical protein
MKKEPVIANRRPSSDPVSSVPRQVMHKRTVIGVAGIALLAACTTPSVSTIASADYPEKKKKYDDCVALEKVQYPVPPGMSYWLEANIRRSCGEPPTRPRDEKK